MARVPDFELPLFAMSDEELIAKVGARGPAGERGEALRLLVRRSIRRAAPILRNIARKAAPIASMRATAAIALGRDADPANQAPLIAALKAPEDRVVRRAAEALGRIGDTKALAALRASRAPSAPAAARAYAFAQSLISYRLGLGSDLIVSQTPLARRERKGDPVAVSAIPTAVARRVAGTLPEEAPAIALAPKGGIAFACRRVAYVVVPAVKPHDPTKVNAVAAVVLRRSGSLDRFALHLYILAHPAGDGTAALHGVRPDGSVTWRGEMREGHEGPTFVLEALDTPLSSPAKVEGMLTPDGAIAADKAKITNWSRPAGVIATRAPRQG